MSTARTPGAFPLLVDHDLLLDLRHLDDPEPPRFGALRAEEAAQRATHARTQRARALAGIALAVALVVGVAAAAVGRGTSSDTVQTANPPLTTLAPTSDTIQLFPTTAPPVSVEPAAPTLAPAPAPTDPVAPLVTTTVPTSVPTTALAAAPAGTVPPSAPAIAAPTTSAPPSPSQPPIGTVAAPAGLVLTLTLDATQITAGTSVRGVVRFQNNRSTAVTVCPGWRAHVYQGGRASGGGGTGSVACINEVLPPGGFDEREVQLPVDAGTPAGTYGAFAVGRFEEGDPYGYLIHSEVRLVTVLRP